MLYPRISPADKPCRDIPQVAENSPLSFCSTHVFCGLSGTTHFSYSSVNCYLKQCWKKNFYPSFIAVMWSKDTTCCSCSSFLLSFKFLFPDIQSNIFWQRPGLCTSVNNFIYIFLWSRAGGDWSLEVCDRHLWYDNMANCWCWFISSNDAKQG